MVSPTQRVFGAGAVKSRSSRFDATGLPVSATVVHVNRFRVLATRLWACISRITRVRPTSMPWARSSRCTRGLPSSQRPASCAARTKTESRRSSFDRFDSGLVLQA